jgi:serine/threonine-protein kinase
VIAVVVAIAVWTMTRDTDRGDGSAGATDSTASSTTVAPTQSSEASPDVPFEQAGLAACDDGFCPTTPKCWGGLVAISGRSESPRPVDCAEPHYWETFAAVEAPTDVATNSEDTLMERADLAQACSADVMSSHSVDATRTQSWGREAWLIEVPGTDVRLVHCLASSEEGESTGSVFAP